ncbi:MAG: hydrogenase maturation nickel metallochaperone HypA [Streptosporangiaceae bacterium]
MSLEIGALSGVVADSPRFCFGLAAEGTQLEGARLDIAEPAAARWCRSTPAQAATWTPPSSPGGCGRSTRPPGRWS